MSNQRLNQNREIALIAMSIAVLVVGGFAIYAINALFPIIGGKYFMMAPYLSAVMYIAQNKLKTTHVMLKLGLTFALTMSFVHPMMGLAIVASVFLTWMTSFWIPGGQCRMAWQSALFSGYCGFVGLMITKFFIDAKAVDVPIVAIVGVGIVCLFFGWLGILWSKTILNRIVNQTPNRM